MNQSRYDRILERFNQKHHEIEGINDDRIRTRELSITTSSDGEGIAKHQSTQEFSENLHNMIFQIHERESLDKKDFSMHN